MTDQIDGPEKRWLRRAVTTRRVAWALMITVWAVLTELAIVAGGVDALIRIIERLQA